MASYRIALERLEFPGKTDQRIASALAHKYGYVAVVRYKSSASSDYDHFGCCKHDYEVEGYFNSSSCHDTEVIYDGRKSPSSGIMLQEGHQLTVTESFLSFVEQLNINSPTPLGILTIGDNGETAFVILLKVPRTEFDSLCNTHKVEPTMDFIPTEYYPNLWFRLQIDDGGKAPLNCEYNFNILADMHIAILDCMVRANNYLMAYFNDSCTKGWAFSFIISKGKKTHIITEIEACRNGIALYHALDTDKFVKGQTEIANSRGVSGEIINIEIVKKQSSRRLSVKPFPLDVEIRFV